MNQLDAMRIYVRVAELASFTSTAEQLGLPKASVSAAVQQLENLLGTRLLHRTTRRVQMTQDGQVFYERSRDMLADMEELQGLFRAGPTELRGRLRVDMPQAVARDLVIPQLPAFLAEHPGLEIELSSTDRRVDLVREGFDCVLRVGTLSDSSLIARPLGHYRMGNFASPAYLARYGTPHTLAELAGHQLVNYLPTLGARPDGFEYVDAQGHTQSIPLPGALSVNATFSYEGACLAGLGIIQVPRAGVRGHLEAGRLIDILPAFTAPAMAVSLLYANRRHLPRRVQVFMHWLAGLMAERLAAD
ncbi:LysR family transcriptional regulator [Uliginosibacterium aquaticum]|uniref:LysR family transcriptional regulator n=1 Tax=Uliginosibacterium aquaticum TaxID=2731212 RepID=A0ABX2IP78_9RHOO|nr:LysR family transcriptional regulator [Uliginosibacterium aquaticum]NSL55920.1 LysR family transcriptional regulator [Uliginosibacterium aquaticum]